MNSSPKVQHNFFLFIFIAAAVVLFFIFRPFLSALVLAGSFAIVFHPLYDRISRGFGKRKSIAALITVLIILVLVLVPLILVGELLFNEARSLYVSLATSSNGGNVGRVVNTLQEHLRIIIPDITLNISQYIQTGLEWVVSHLNAFFSGFLNVILTIFVMIIALFFLLRDGRSFRDTLFTLSPLGQEYDQGIFSKLTMAVNSIIKGSLVVALIQGIFATVGLTLAGVPNPILLGVAATFSSLIPGVGTSLIMIPSIVYLLLTHPLWYGLGLAAWSAFGIGLVDNFLSPHILRRGIKIHPFLILISVLGGISFFGPIGFILGPVALAFFFALLDIYPSIIHE